MRSKERLRKNNRTEEARINERKRSKERWRKKEMTEQKKQE